MPSKKASSSERGCAVKVGFVPLIDCAPLAVAQEFGFFAKHGLEVELVREPGWASIRDKIVYGEMDAAHAIAGLAFAVQYGLGSVRQDCLTGFLFNSHGDAITLSTELVEAGVTSAEGMAAYLRGARREKPLVLGVVHLYSSHHFILRDWLRRAGIVPERDVRIVVVPPPLMSSALEAGHLDGYCVGEPYNTVAAEAGLGRVVATSAALSQMHPEKALIVRRDFAEGRHDEHLRLIAALQESCVFCDEAVNRPGIAMLLSKPRYLHMDRAILEASLCGGVKGPGGIEGEELHIFSRYGVNRPGPDKANWILTQMRLCGLMGPDDLEGGRMKSSGVFRADLYDEGVALVEQVPARGVKGVVKRKVSRKKAANKNQDQKQCLTIV